MPARRFSVIIPAYNEAAYLPRLLDSLSQAQARYRGGAAAVEIVVADNASTDGTAAIAEARGCRAVRVTKRVIGAARNGGARAAEGEILCFVDADMRVHPETFNAIDGAFAGGRVHGGATGVRLERVSPGIALTWLLLVPMVWVFGIDTGVVFCRREDFVTMGGYPEDRLVAEDVRFLMALKRLGRRRGQRLVRLRRAKAIASTRKFDRHGDWHLLRVMPRMAWHWVVNPRRMEEMARAYWYEDR